MISINKSDYPNAKLAVALLHFNENAEVLAVSRKHDHNDLNLCAGKVEEFDTDLIQAITREVKEETGLDVINPQPFFVRKGNNHTTITFICDGCDGEISTTEEGIVKFVDFDSIGTGTFGAYNKALKEFYYKNL